MADTVVKVDEMARKRDRIRNVMEYAKPCSGKNRAAKERGRLRCARWILPFGRGPHRALESAW